jgi:histone deacetylase 6
MEAHEMLGHFECPARHRVVVNEIKADGLAARCVPLTSRQATDVELLRVHDAEHVAGVRTAFDPTGEPVQVATVDDDTGNDIFYTKDTSDGARMAAGCVTEACEAVLRGDVQRAFAVVRPPGHHALCARAMGFCFFNNTVVAARAALERDDVKRVLILDWDVHHGNGIQDLTLEDDSIMYCSLHRYGDGFYPGTGHAEEIGKNATNINIGWREKGLGDADYLAAFDIVIEPIVRSYAPDLIIIAAGFDAADGDPLGGMMLSATGYGHMTRRLCDIGSGRVVIALEGGYALRPLATCASASLRALLGDAPRAISSRSRPRKSSVKFLTELAAAFAPYWPALKSEEYSEKVRGILKHTTVVASRRAEAYPTGRRTASSGSMSSSATAV